MSDTLVTVATFWNAVEAALARGRLEDAGIRAFLAGEQTVGMVWWLGNAIGGVKLQVGDRDAEAALDILSESDAADSPEAAPDGAGAALSSEAQPARPVEGEPSARLVDEESGESERVLTAREEDADRAFRGAVIGLFLTPLQLYVSWLLLKVLFSDEELRPDKRRAALWAAAINIPLMIAMGVLLRIG